MKERIIAVLLCSLLACSVAACGQKELQWKQDKKEQRYEETMKADEKPEEAREIPEEMGPVVSEEEAEETEEPVSREDYCYAAILTLLSRSEEMSSCFGISHEDLNGNPINRYPEENEFTIADINGDGMRELLVKCDDIYGRRWIYAYQYGKLWESTNIWTDYYADGWVVDWYEESRKEGFVRQGGRGSDVSISVITDSEELAAWLGEEYASVQADEDDPVYVWYYQYQTGEQELIGAMNREEHEAKLKENHGEKLDFSWQNMTAENIGALVHGSPEDSEILQIAEEYNTPLNRYLFGECEMSGRNGEVKGCLQSYVNESTLSSVLINLMYWNAMSVEECLPSAKIISEEDNLVRYRVKEADFQIWSDEAFDFYPVGDLPKDQWLWDNGDDTLILEIDWLNGEGDLPGCHVISADQKDGRIILKGVFTAHYGYFDDGYYFKNGYYFECELEKNPSSPLNGYRILNVRTDHIFYLDEHNLSDLFFGVY